MSWRHWDIAGAARTVLVPHERSIVLDERRSPNEVLLASLWVQVDFD